MNEQAAILIREFVKERVFTPAEVAFGKGGNLVALVRPENSSRTLRITAHVVEVKEL